MINRDSSDPRNFSIDGAHLTKSALTDLSIRYVGTLCLSHERNRNRSKSNKSPFTIMVDREFSDSSWYLFLWLYLLNVSRGKMVRGQVMQKVGYWKHISFLSLFLENTRFTAIWEIKNTQSQTSNSPGLRFDRRSLKELSSEIYDLGEKNWFFRRLSQNEWRGKKEKKRRTTGTTYRVSCHDKSADLRVANSGW